MALAFDPIRPRSLRGQIIGLVAALAVPLIALQVWWGYRESQRAEEAAATASSIGQFLDQSQAILTAASTLFGQIFVSGLPCEAGMGTLVELFPFLTSVTTVGRDCRDSLEETKSSQKFSQ